MAQKFPQVCVGQAQMIQTETRAGWRLALMGWKVLGLALDLALKVDFLAVAAKLSEHLVL